MGIAASSEGIGGGMERGDRDVLSSSHRRCKYKDDRSTCLLADGCTLDRYTIDRYGIDRYADDSNLSACNYPIDVVMHSSICCGGSTFRLAASKPLISGEEAVSRARKVRESNPKLAKELYLHALHAMHAEQGRVCELLCGDKNSDRSIDRITAYEGWLDRGGDKLCNDICFAIRANRDNSKRDKQADIVNTDSRDSDAATSYTLSRLHTNDVDECDRDRDRAKCVDRAKCIDRCKGIDRCRDIHRCRDMDSCREMGKDRSVDRSIDGSISKDGCVDKDRCIDKDGSVDRAVDKGRSVCPASEEYIDACVDRSVYVSGMGNEVGSIEDREMESEILAELGEVYLCCGEHRKALDCYTTAILLSPHRLVYRYKRGVVLQQLGEIDLAISVFRDILELDPAYEAALFNLGVCLTMKRDNSDGNGDKNINRNRNKNINKDRNTNANNYQDYKEHSREALLTFERILSINPNNDSALEMIADIHEKEGRVEEAYAIRQRVVTLDPKNYRANRELARLELSLLDRREIGGYITLN